MSNLTTILEDEAGIQYQGAKDASSQTGTYPVVGLIIGQFKRGRYDKPMTITRGNIRGQLGYEPENPNYVAVQDVLNAGVPSVQVLRIQTDSGMCIEPLSSGYLWPMNPLEPIAYDSLREILNSLTIELNKDGNKILYNDYVEMTSGATSGAYIEFSRYELIPTIRFTIPVAISSVIFCCDKPFQITDTNEIPNGSDGPISPPQPAPQ